MPTSNGKIKFVVVAVDYFIKWEKSESLAQITEQKMTGFLWKSIICKFIDNEKKFDNPRFRGLYEGLRINIFFSLLAYPQANGQVEAVNKIIKHHLNTKSEKHKGAWANQLLFVL